MILGDVIYQGSYFAAALFCGIVSGFIYDVLFAARVFFRGGKILQVLLDVVFCLISAALVFYIFYTINGFNIKWYMIMGIFAGFSLQRVLFAKPVAILCNYVYNKIAAAYKKAGAKFAKIFIKRRKKNKEDASYDGETAL